MPASVHVPSRVRVDDADVLIVQADAIVEALRDAATRSLHTSREQVLGPRAGFADVELHPPVVTWTGAGAGELPDAVRQEIEGHLAAAVTSAVEDTGVASTGVQAIVRGVELGELPEPVRERIEIVEWAPVRDADELTCRFDEEVMAQRLFTPESGYMGAIFRRGGRVAIVVARFPLRINVLALEAAEPQRFVLGTDGRIRYTTVVLPPDSTYHVRYLAVSRTAAEARAIMREFYGPGLADEVRATAKRLTAYDDEASVAREVDELIAEMTRNGPWDRTWYAAELTTSVGTFLLWSAVPMPEDLDAELVPIVHTVERVSAEDAAREGQEGDVEEPVEAGEPTEEAPPVGEALPVSAPVGFVWTEQPGQATFGPGGLKPWTQHCAPYRDEPPLEELGPAGAALAVRIGAIAAKLQIAPCGFAGGFCLDAASALEARSRQVARAPVPHSGRIVPAATGSEQYALIPVASAELQLLRHLATIPGELAALARDTASLYLSNRERRWTAADWTLHFMPAFHFRLNTAVGVHFGATCRLLLLQMLHASAQEIVARHARVASDAPAFAAVVLPMLQDLDELKQLRAALYAVLPKSTLESVGGAVYTTWREARRALIELAEGRNPFDGPPPAAGTIIGEGADAAIVDRRGATWRLADLDQVIGIREGIAAKVDPLTRQIIDDPILWRRFLAPDADFKVLQTQLLEEMLTANTDITARAAASFIYGLRMGRISRDDIPVRIGQFNLSLQGIHLAAHEAVAPYYGGDSAYEEGLRALLGREVMLEEAYEYATFGVEVLLAVRFPPAVMAFGAVTSFRARERALERGRVFRALIDPDVVLHRVEAEAELFAAELAAALSFIPGVYRLLASGRTLTRLIARRGVASGTRQFVKYASRTITRSIARELEEGLIRAVAREVVEEYFEDVIIDQLLITPAIEQLRQEFEGAG